MDASGKKKTELDKSKENFTHYFSPIYMYPWFMPTQSLHYGSLRVGNVFVSQLNKGHSFCFAWIVKFWMSVTAVNPRILFLPTHYDAGGEAYK